MQTRPFIVGNFAKYLVRIFMPLEEFNSLISSSSSNSTASFVLFILLFLGCSV
jgi:predicted permease